MDNSYYIARKEDFQAALVNSDILSVLWVNDKPGPIKTRLSSHMISVTSVPDVADCFWFTLAGASKQESDRRIYLI